MAKKPIITEDEDDEDKTPEMTVVEVDEVPSEVDLAARAARAAEAAEEPKDADHEDDEDDEDTRLAESEDDDDKKKEKRKKRREAQKAARDRTLHALDSAHRKIADLEGTVTQLVGNQSQFTEQDIKKRIGASQAQLRDLDSRISTAVEQGNGAALVEAMSQRDTVRDNIRTLESTQEKLVVSRDAKPATDTRTQSFANSWREQNPWYGRAGNETQTELTKRVDNALTSENWDPATVGYWQELTRRVSAASETPRQEQQREDNGQRRAPPVGRQRQHVPDSSRKEVYVTPERKQAMQDAGIWDDPKRRDRVLAQYAEQDAQRGRH